MIQGGVMPTFTVLQPAIMVKGTSKRSLNEMFDFYLKHNLFSFCPHANIILKFACDSLIHILHRKALYISH